MTIFLSQLLVLYLFSIATAWCTVSSRYRRTPNVATEPVDDIQFDIPDIVVLYPYATKSVTLEAFKVRNRTSNEIPKWVSIGYPEIAHINATGNGSRAFTFTEEIIIVQIRMLNTDQRKALFNKAKQLYPTENVMEDNIIPLPLIQFACSISFYTGGQPYQIRGSVYDLRRNPLMLRFQLHNGNAKRSAFEQRLENPDSLFLECELAATGKQEKINTLKISAEQFQQIGMVDKLLGPANEKYVVRNQLTQVSQEIKSKLHIEESYEIDDEQFSEEFIQKILDSSASKFEPVPIDEALSKLSKYGASFDQRDLSPSEIKRELSDVLQIKTDGSKQRIVAKRGDSERTSSNLDIDTSVSGSASFLGIAEASTDISFARKKSNEWSKNTSSLDDQLRELNQHSKSAIKWEQEGSRIVPRSLNVAKVTRMTLTQQMSFTRIKKRVSNAKYNRMYEIGTSDTGRVDEQNNIAAVERHAAALGTELHQLRVDEQNNNAAVEQRAAALSLELFQLRSSLYYRGPYAKYVTLTTECVDLTNYDDVNYGWYAGLHANEHFGLKTIGCHMKGSDWYLHQVHWTRARTCTRGSSSANNVIEATLKCCRRVLNVDTQEVIPGIVEV